MILICKVQRDISINILIVRKICYLFRILRFFYLNFSSPHVLEMRFRNESFESMKTFMGLSFYRR